MTYINDFLYPKIGVYIYEFYNTTGFDCQESSDSFFKV